MKRLMFALATLLLAAVVVLFVLENQQSVSLVLMGWASPAIPLAVIAMLALVVGLMIGPLIALLIVLRSKARAQRSAA